MNQHEQIAAALEAGRYHEAMQLLHTTLAQQPTAEWLLARGRVYTLLSNTESALADFRAASKADPSGDLGDQARSEMLKLLAPPPPEQPPVTYVPARELPHRWIVLLIVLLLMVSFVCAFILIINIGEDIVAPYLTPTPRP